MIRHLTTALALALVTPVALADDARLEAWYETSPAGFTLTTELTAAEGQGFALLASLGEGTFDQAGSLVLGIGDLDGVGAGRLQFHFPEDLLPLPKGAWVSFKAIYKGADGFVTTDQADFVLGQPKFGETLSFEHTIGDNDAIEMVAGRVIDEQWAAAGVHVWADNKDVHHPDKAILFDTDNPTGEDDDLGVGEGLALIIAEDDWDGNNDGLVDDPDDEQKGGRIVFDFDVPATICSIRLADIDENPGTELRFYRDGNTDDVDHVIPVVSMADGSVQEVFFLEERVDRFEVFFKGSGAIGGMELVICPRTLNFDETTLGIELGFQAGEWLTDDLAFMGIGVSAFNNHPLHPQKAILFDTANPTGGDDDLMTPNPDNPTNNEALGYVVIIAENDVDDDDDGLVDDPDDELNGGRIRFDFEEATTVHDLKVLDCDANEVDIIQCLDENDDIISMFVVPDEPDGSVQTIAINTSGVRALVVDLGGSGAVAKLRTCPDQNTVPTGGQN